MNTIKIKIKNRYSYLRDGLDDFGDKINLFISEDGLILNIDDDEAILVEDDFFGILSRSEIENGTTYRFSMIDYVPTSDNQELWVKLKVDPIRLAGDKYNYAKHKLNYAAIDKRKIIGIYLLEIDGVNYIGQSNDIYRRLDEHLNELSNGSHVNSRLQEAWDSNFVTISLSILKQLTHNLSALRRQEWLAENEQEQIKKFANTNLANQTAGEFIPTADSYVEYVRINQSAEQDILRRRKARAARLNKVRDSLTIKDREIATQLSEVSLKLHEFRSKLSLFRRFLSVLGIKSAGEAQLRQSKRTLEIAYSRNQEKIFEIKFKVSQLRRRKFTEQEVFIMHQLGRQYKPEFRNFRQG